MGSKTLVTDDKKPAENVMNTACLSDPRYAGKTAKGMSNDLISRFHRGPGDTIEAAAYRAQMATGVDVSTLMQGRNREPRDMRTSRWLPLFAAWWVEVGSKAQAAYEAEAQDAPDTIITGLAAFVAPTKDEEK